MDGLKSLAIQKFHFQMYLIWTALCLLFSEGELWFFSSWQLSVADISPVEGTKEQKLVQPKSLMIWGSERMGKVDRGSGGGRKGRN